MKGPHHQGLQIPDDGEKSCSPGDFGACLSSTLPHDTAGEGGFSDLPAVRGNVKKQIPLTISS